MSEPTFDPARELVDYVGQPGGDRTQLLTLLYAVRDMAEALPEDTEADPDSDAEAPEQDPGGVLNLLVTNLPFLDGESGQQLALVVIDLIETLWYLDHVNRQEAVWYCRFGYGCHWGVRLGLVLEAFESPPAGPSA